MSAFPRRARPAVVALVALVALAALSSCRHRAPVGTGPYADKVADDVPKIEQALGVPFKTPPKLELRTREQVRDLLLAKLDEPATQKEVADEQAAYKVLGLIPDTLHLDSLMVRVLTEQILGYYDPHTKVLYVVQGAPDDYVGITIMHELVHALQDQYVNLDSIEHITGDDDRALAAQSVVEGQATYEQMYIMAGGGGNIAAQLPGGWTQMRDAIREATQTQPMFSSAPMVIQESLLFPYINGADFVRRYKAHGRGGLPVDSLPISSTQVMHDTAYFGKHKDVPSLITLPPIPNTIDENDFGEFGTRLFVYNFTREQDESIRAADGWDGDRYALVKTPRGNAIVWVIVWDTPNDAAEFASAVDAVMNERFGVTPVVNGDHRHFATATRTVDVQVRDVAGRPVSLYVDVPAGESTDLIDFSKVKIVPR